MRRLTIIGASGHGKVVASIAELNGYTDIVFLDNNPEIQECAGYPVIGTDEMAVEIEGELFVAVGKADDRKRLMKRFQEKEFPILIHPEAVIANDVIVGEGTVIMAGTVINSGATIGKGCIINTSSSIDHDCIIGDCCHVSVGTHLCGAVCVGDNSWVGAGAIVSNNISICANVLVGAGAVVIRDIVKEGTYIGVPARALIKNKAIEPIAKESETNAIKILFTGVGRRIELLQAFRNAALVLDKNLKIYGADMAGTAPALAYCDYARRVVAMNDPNYLNDLLRICQEDGIDLVIPTIDTDLMVLSENRDRFEQIGAKVMISAPDKIRICRDKNHTSQFFVDCGLYAPMPVNDWKKYQAGYPAFIKPKDGSSSINAYKVEDEKQLKFYAGQVNDYIIQPFISGREYTIDIFCDWNGKPISIVPRERIQIRAGEVYKTKIELDKKMIEESKQLCAVFKPCGPMTVQLIRDEQGKDWFIEINPRFGGGTPLSMKAGARSAEAIIKLIEGRRVNYCNDIADEAIYSRFDQSVCISEGKSRTRGVIFSLDGTLYPKQDHDKQAESHQYDLHLYEGVSDMIEQLKKRDIRIGIITDGDPVKQRKKIKALKLNSVDDIIVTDELGGKQFRKPCDIAFRLIQTRWRMHPSEIVYVADDPDTDFQATQQLGMKSIWFDNKEKSSSIDYETNGRVKRITDISKVAEYI